MSNKVKKMDIKNRTYYFLDYAISIESFDPRNIEIDEKSYKNILIYYTGYVAMKDSKHAKIISANPSYLIFDKVNGYIEEINKNKYLTLVPTDESKGEKNEQLWSKIRDLIRSISKISDDYDEKYMKIKFN